MEFTYEIKGITLTMSDMVQIHEYYQAACTAEYLMDNYGFDHKKALDAGYDIRRKMNKYGYDEEDAIREYLDETPVEDEEDEDDDE